MDLESGLFVGGLLIAALGEIFIFTGQGLWWLLGAENDLIQICVVPWGKKYNSLKLQQYHGVRLKWQLVQGTMSQSLIKGRSNYFTKDALKLVLHSIFRNFNQNAVFDKAPKVNNKWGVHKTRVFKLNTRFKKGGKCSINLMWILKWRSAWVTDVAVAHLTLYIYIQVCKKKNK